MPADEEWCLIANYADKSLLRIPLAYNLGAMIGMDWSPRLRYVELYLNGSYNGLYNLCEKIKKADERVNIKKLDKTSTADKISGGYILNIDRIDVGDTVVRTPRLNFIVKYPKPKNISTEQTVWIEQYVNELESALYGDTYTDPETGYRKYIDVPSFIDWYLINELAKDADAAMYLSIYFYKERGEKLKMGPVWDFDIAFGNYAGTAGEYENDLYIANATWFNRLFTDPTFVAQVRARYEELKPTFDKIPALIAHNAKQTIDAGAIARNFERWPRLGHYDWPNVAPYPTTYEGELQRLMDWTMARSSWLNVHLAISPEESCTKLAAEKIPIRPYDTDKFSAGNTTSIRTVLGYAKYVWNGTIETTTNELNIERSGKYWVRVENASGCSSIISDTLEFVDRDSQKIAQLETELAEAEQDNAALVDDTTRLYEQTQALQGELTDANNNIATLFYDTTRLYGQTLTLQETLTDANNNIATLIDDTTRLYGKTQSLQETLTAANNNITTLVDDTTRLYAQTQTLQENLTAANSNIATLVNDTTRLYDQTQSLQGELTDANNNIATLVNDTTRL
jgi:predicted  nucleic acid-binding Zn-ribbon protein